MKRHIDPGRASTRGSPASYARRAIPQLPNSDDEPRKARSCGARRNHLWSKRIDPAWCDEAPFFMDPHSHMVFLFADKYLAARRKKTQTGKESGHA